MKVKKLSLLTIDEVILKSTLEEFNLKKDGNEILNSWGGKVCEVKGDELIFNGVITSDGLKLISVLEQSNQKEYTLEINKSSFNGFNSSKDYYVVGFSIVLLLLVVVVIRTR